MCINHVVCVNRNVRGFIDLFIYAQRIGNKAISEDFLQMHKNFENYN
jgi:hypothetical protein